MEQDLLVHLNKPQREAVTATEGPVLIIAGPGSGKTRVITHRIAYLIQQGVVPHEILAVTFTNKAAKEMKERLATLVGDGKAKALTISTFHSIGARLLRHEPSYLAQYGLNSNYTILDTGDSERIIKQALKHTHVDDLHLSFQKPPAASDILAKISWSKAHLWDYERFREEAGTDLERLAARVRPIYDQMVRNANGMDFDDILIYMEHLLRSQVERLRWYQRRWKFIHVDEWQDCNLPQYEFIHWLAAGTPKALGGTGHICVVGDDDQLIYSWRGASVENIRRFEEHFPLRKVILLEQNYRSTEVILSAAQYVVRENKDRKEKALWTECKGGELVHVETFFDDREEARRVAVEIKRLKDRGQILSWKDVAVLYRVNSQSRTVEEAMRRLLIPYTVIGNKSFYERKEIKDMLAYLRLLYNPRDNQALLRIINVPSRQLGEATIAKLQTWAELQQYSLLQAIEQVQGCPGLSAAAKRSLAEFGMLMKEFQQVKASLSLLELFDYVFEKTGYQVELERPQEADIDRAGNVVELRRVAEEVLEEAEPEDALQVFLESTALLGSTESEQTGSHGKIAKENLEVVRLMTLHAAKGQEYPVVIIIGMSEGSIPHSRSWDVESLKEERRLAYVGLTRAKTRLYLFSPTQRYIAGEVRETTTSRFLDDIPTHLTK